MNSKNKLYILERLENSGTDEDKDVYRHWDEGKYSIEHIMPQHLTPTWVKELGEDYENIHDIWLHRIANLTLTAYNSKYSNSSFNEKKTMQNGFADSGIRMNTYVAQFDKWTQKELENRNNYLKERALGIWPAPKTSFKPIEKQMDTYTLEDEENLAGRVISKFSFKNTEQPVTSWIEMYNKILKILYAEDKSILMKLAISNEDGLATHFSLDEEAFNKATEIGDGIFVWTNTNTASKLSVLRRLFKLYEEDAEELTFYLRDENEPSNEEIGTRYELRRKYWSYALEFIHKSHGTECFNNVNGSKDNWINGFFGVSGCSICLVSNYDSARVELYLGNRDRDFNKETFDKLFNVKEDIENALGVRLIWNRNDSAKSSKIYYELENVSIGNEVDWLQMANFQAEWSKKFYDVIVPYIVNK